uniref:Uncharacterized protein n=1 Tax=Plectus sambesii TaxID=2011161 RepID=A0A914X1G6_9BILA
MPIHEIGPTQAPAQYCISQLSAMLTGFNGGVPRRLPIDERERTYAHERTQRPQPKYESGGQFFGRRMVSFTHPDVLHFRRAVCHGREFSRIIPAETPLGRGENG